MIQSIAGILLIGLGLLGLILQRLYSVVPAHELKRLAAQRDALSSKLYLAVAYGASVRLLLWLVTGLGFAFGVTLFTTAVPGWAAVATLLLLSIAVFVWAPSAQLTMRSAAFAAWFAPALAWVLHYLNQPMAHLAGFIRAHRHMPAHTGIFEKEDLLRLVDRQKTQHGNRVSAHDLEIIQRALQFDERQAADIVQSRHGLRLVDAQDTIGPILLGELHTSGQTSFLVYEDKPENIIGTLSMRDAVKAKQGGRVMELTRHDLCYVHEDFSLSDVLAAFIHTKQHVAVVINAFEECVGVITLDRLIQQLLGDIHEEPFDSYEDRAAIAHFKPQKPAARPHQAEASADEPGVPADSTPETAPSVNDAEVVE